MIELRDFYKGKTILVTGGVGSIGSEIVRSILKYEPKAVRVLDTNETGLFDLDQELKSEKIRLLVGDIKDKERLRRAIENVDVVFHAAALKHVPLCEYNPFEAVKTNAVGTQNLIDVALDGGVRKFVTISTDKAVNPINVMGATKLLAERLTVSANLYKGKHETAFSCVRFGNVTHTRGSVIPLFMKQIQSGSPLTVTNMDMTRFIMSIKEASELVLKVPEMSKGGEIFILKMPSMRMDDLANAMIEEFSSKYGYDQKDIGIQIIGKRAGEKLFEELMSEDESTNAFEDENMFIILPEAMIAEDDIPATFKKVLDTEYSSENAKLLTKEELKRVLTE
ncbi:FlaA1/EpsC-like NDP-sugar epimerase [Methanohalophilus levihalophilus]|uniref:UDP-N-acetylglucosamine 4,6-dehydratase family protein n=1 Tax=Methanohalophilus levihalophilus TaxID=1431282 RepID=UPI003159F67C|nr:FlaA1/EpsC-like NDP-sugar epimerase [Methanohalophilus levihalophilus]